MLTAIVRPRTYPVKFVLHALAASLGVFALLRLAWIEAHLVIPVTRLQGAVAVGLFGTPAVPVEATQACSGADALALCLGAVLAYPVKWRMRVAGAVAGVALILALNTVRIGTLGQAAASPWWFDALHLYAWPMVLTLAIAGYVFAWIRLSDGPCTSDVQAQPSAESSLAARPRPSRRFVMLTAAALLLFGAVSPLYLQSRAVFALGGFIASAAAATLGVLGISAHAAANVLWTSRGGFLVTQECISTPLIPVYLAAICAYSTTWRWLGLGVAATLPLFIVLGVARLLMVALPAAAGSPEFLVHSFYQLLAGAVVVCAAACWRHGGRAALGPGFAGVTVAVLFVALLGPSYTRLISFPATAALDDPQGAIAFLPAFQVGLYLALWVAAFMTVARMRALGGLAILGLTQMAGLLALDALARHGGLAHVRDVRGWAVAGPVLIFAAVMHRDRPRR